MKRFAPMALFFFLTLSSAVAAEEFVHLPRTDLSSGEKAGNFGIVYVAQWASYVLTQPSNIRDHGSFQNWKSFIFRPHFDRDGIRYNVIQHSVAGNYYYLFYRSRGYDEKASVFWSIASSAAFEFTIETITERPSVQDLYQTPILGSLLGMGMERASLFLHSQGTWPARALGYVLNPFTLFTRSAYGFRASPTFVKGGAGASVSVVF